MTGPATDRPPGVLRVVSFNIRNCRSFDGWNSWPFRRRVTAAALEQLDPDIIGVQEAYRSQERYLARSLPGHEVDGRGRRDGHRGERCSVFHRRRVVASESARTRWFSDAPDSPGTRLPGASFPRIATIVGLVDTRTQRQFTVANAHLDEHHAENRSRAVDLLLDWLPLERPTILMGDLNATPGDALFDRLRTAGLRPALPVDAGGTAHQFSGRKDGRRIDHILVSPAWTVVGAGISHTRPAGRLPSDHWPLFADLQLR